MRFATPAKTTLIINEHVRLTGIPEAAHRYVVNGRTPLEWFIDRYRIKRDKESGILNDPNGWFENPRDLVTAIERIVYVQHYSGETNLIDFTTDYFIALFFACDGHHDELGRVILQKTEEIKNMIRKNTLGIRDIALSPRKAYLFARPRALLNHMRAI